MTASTSPDVLEHGVGASGEVSLRLHAGHLEARATDRDTIRIRDLDGGDLSDRFVIDTGSGRLALRPRDGLLVDFGFALAGFGRGARLAVEAPRGVRLTVDTASAEIRATGFRAEQRYRTASGTIELDDVAGEINVEAVSGDIGVRVEGDAGLTGRSVSGDVTVVGGRLRSVALSTTSGDVELRSRLDGPGPFGVQTVSGDVSIASPGRLRVEGRTVTGDISTTAPHKRESSQRGQVLVLGEAGAGVIPISFKSISGDLRINTPEADTTVRTPEPTDAEPDDRGAERLAVLRELEAGTIGIEEASTRLRELEGGD
jgi:hypothetical protein